MVGALISTGSKCLAVTTERSEEILIRAVSSTHLFCQAEIVRLITCRLICYFVVAKEKKKEHL